MTWIGYTVAVLVGVPASFVPGAAVFADGPPILSAERILPVIAAYLIATALLGFVFRLVSPASVWWRLGVSFSIPALLIVGLMGRDIGIGHQALFVAIALVSACLGAFAGALPAAALRPRRS